MLGFNTKQHDGTGAPDGTWWSEDCLFYVFEAKSNEGADGPVSFETVRQAAVHPTWLKNNDRELPPQRETHVIVVTPRVSVQEEAAKLADGMHYVPIDDMQKLFDAVAAVLNEVRAKAIGLDEETLSEVILDVYQKKGLAGQTLHNRLTARLLRTLPITRTN